MIIGTCRLCLRPAVELQDSHVMPAGIYSIVCGEHANPVHVNRTVAIATSKQVRAHLLCSDCEQRFSKRGEDWTIRNCWHALDDFTLHDGLGSSTAKATGDGLHMYLTGDVPELKIDQLVYFAASVFWRAAAHK